MEIDWKLFELNGKRVYFQDEEDIWDSEDIPDEKELMIMKAEWFSFLRELEHDAKRQNNS